MKIQRDWWYCTYMFYSVLYQIVPFQWKKLQSITDMLDISSEPAQLCSPSHLQLCICQVSWRINNMQSEDHEHSHGFVEISNIFAMHGDSFVEIAPFDGVDQCLKFLPSSVLCLRDYGLSAIWYLLTSLTYWHHSHWYTVFSSVNTRSTFLFNDTVYTTVPAQCKLFLTSLLWKRSDLRCSH